MADFPKLLWDFAKRRSFEFVLGLVSGWIIGLFSQPSMLIILENISYHRGWYLSEQGTLLFCLSFLLAMLICA